MVFLFFLIGCWLGCLTGFFLASLLSGRLRSKGLSAGSKRIPHNTRASIFIR
jgi:hypothetical protein